jgi:hypothetical protein
LIVASWQHTIEFLLNILDNKKTSRVDDASDLITRVDRLQERKNLRVECWSGHSGHPRGRFSVYHIPQLSTSSPIRWIMSWNTHGISDIFITWLFRLVVSRLDFSSAVDGFGWQMHFENCTNHTRPKGPKCSKMNNEYIYRFLGK